MITALHIGDKSPSVGCVDVRLDVGHTHKGRREELCPFSSARTKLCARTSPVRGHRRSLIRTVLGITYHRLIQTKNLGFVLRKVYLYLLSDIIKDAYHFCTAEQAIGAIIATWVSIMAQNHLWVFQAPGITGGPSDTLSLPLARPSAQLWDVLAAATAAPWRRISAGAVIGTNIPETHYIPTSFLWPPGEHKAAGRPY